VTLVFLAAGGASLTSPAATRADVPAAPDSAQIASPNSAQIASLRAAGWVPRPGIEVSGSYGTMSRTSQVADFGVLEGAYGGGWSVGATAEWMLAPTWWLVSGLRYVEVGQSQAFTVTVSGTGGPFTFGGDLHNTWRWLAVPVHAKVTPWALPLSFEVGPEVQVLLVAKWRTDLEMGVPPARRGASPGIRFGPASTIFEGVGTFDGDRDVTDLYRRVNYVLSGGVSYAWRVRSSRVVAHARCGFGLNDLMKSDAIVSHTRTVEVGAGWQW
jgi:hypothetical protein